MGLTTAFFDHILADPAADAPRLVYADWLEDHGQADRAEFIRLQCLAPELALGSPEAAASRARRRDLFRRHKHRWLPSAGSVDRVGYARGFPVRLSFHPHRPVGCRTLAGWDELRFVRDLDLEDQCIGDPGIDALSRCGRLPSLRRLNLSNNHITPRGLEVLLAADFLPRLRALWLGGNPLSDDGRALIGRCAGVRRLEILDIDGDGPRLAR